MLITATTTEENTRGAVLRLFLSRVTTAATPTIKKERGKKIGKVEKKGGKPWAF